MLPWEWSMRGIASFYKASFKLARLCGWTFMLLEVLFSTFNRCHAWFHQLPAEWDEDYVRTRAWEVNGLYLHPQTSQEGREAFYKAFCALWLPPPSADAVMDKLRRHLYWNGLKY